VAYKEDSVERAIEHVEQEEDEMFLSVEANAVVDPGTVVVHAADASLADRTVVTVRRLDRVAFLTFLLN